MSTLETLAGESDVHAEAILVSRPVTYAPPRPAPMRDVLLCYLTDGEHVSHSFMRSLKALEEWDATRGRRLYGIAPTRASAGSLGKARNAVTRGFLTETTAQWLLMVDTDHGFMADSLDKLLAVADPVKVPVVSALNVGVALDEADGMAGFKTALRLVAFGWDGTGFLRALTYPENALWRAYAGAGFLLVHRGVYERIGADWWSTLRDGNGTELSEDLSFMLRLIEADIPAHVHTGVMPSHHKPMWVSARDYVG